MNKKVVKMGIKSTKNLYLSYPQTVNILSITPYKTNIIKPHVNVEISCAGLDADSPLRQLIFYPNKEDGIYPLENTLLENGNLLTYLPLANYGECSFVIAQYSENVGISNVKKLIIYDDLGTIPYITTKTNVVKYGDILSLNEGRNLKSIASGFLSSPIEDSFDGYITIIELTVKEGDDKHMFFNVKNGKKGSYSFSLTDNDGNTITIPNVTVELM
jgi:hypothetical protein